MTVFPHCWEELSCRAPTMRLINARTRRLELFDDSKATPRYVVLSYGWKYDERRVLDNLYDSQAVFQGQSFPGLEAARGEALRRGVDYVWIDTCCIAKTANIRPAVIINSQFRMYQQSVACFAYLDDLDSLDDANAELWESRWFTCAWTLQGLIAAPDIEFYDHNWTLLSSKRVLLSALSMYTEVDSQVLVDSKCLSEVPLGKRITWSAHRKTRCAEGVACSLLRIFDPRMSVYYSEGTSAFLRLQRNISQHFYDGSLSVQQSASTECYYTLVAELPSKFSHFAGTPPSEPLALQIAMQPRNTKNRVYGVLVVEGGEPGHLLLGLSNGSPPFSLGIIPNKWNRRFIRVQPRRLLKPSELPEELLCEIAGWITCLHVNLDLGTSESPLNKQPSEWGRADTSGKTLRTQWAGEGVRSGETWTNKCPLSVEDQALSACPASEECDQTVRTYREDRSDLDDTEVSIDDSIDDADSNYNDDTDNDYDDDDEEEEEAFKLLVSTDPCFPQLSHTLASQIEGAETLALEAFLTFLYPNQGAVKRQHRGTSPRSSKRRRLEQLYTQLAGSELRDLVDPEPGIVDFSRQSSSFLACPYFLRYPGTYQNCLTRPDPRNIHALRVHIACAHQRPIACPMCGTVFTTAFECDGHIRARTCEIVPEICLEGVTDAQVRQLGRRGTPDLSDAEQWFAIWRIVFPLEEPPALSCVPTSMEPFVAFIQTLRDFWARDGEVVVKEFAYDNERGGEKPPVDLRDLEAVKAAVLGRAIGVLIDLFKQAEALGGSFSGVGAVSKLLQQLSGQHQPTKMQL